MTSNDPTNVKGLITRWPQINDNIQYLIMDKHGKSTGKWQPGAVSDVCREKAQLTLVLYAVDDDLDSGSSAAGAQRRTLTVDYPGKHMN